MIAPGETQTLWDATAPRHLALAGRLDILCELDGLRVPRVVLDPGDPTGDSLLHHDPSTLSELAQAEGHFRRRYSIYLDTEDLHRAELLGGVRHHPDLEVLDLDADEADDAATFSTPAFAARHGLDAPLGRGEAAVLAVAGNRELRAGIDDGAARHVASELGVDTFTTQDALRAAVTELRMSSAEAEALNAQLRRGGFYGAPSLFA